MTASRAPVVVVGGGWAGLAAAVELSAAGVPVTLLEAAPRAGGRARSVPFGETLVDNGQHLLTGAYRQTLRLMTTVGVAEQRVLRRRPLELALQGDGPPVRLALPRRLPAPLHLAWGLLRARGLSRAERFAALRLSTGLRRDRFRIGKDIPVADLLRAYRQPPRLVRTLWEPLCLAALNTPIAEASARIFLRVLEDSFASHRADSDLLFPAADLGTVFPEPALAYIKTHGGQVRLGARVTGLAIADGAVRGVSLGEELLAAERVILAVPPPDLLRLLSPHPAFVPLTAPLSGLSHEPITTVYLQYPASVRLGREMLGLVGTTAQWVVDRGICGQPGLMSVVISGPGPHMGLGREELTAVVAAELADRFPAWPTPLGTFTLREKRATIASAVDVHRLRPGNRTPLPGCWLAGDFTNTGYPATLEGAVRSGVDCARQVMTPPHGG